MESHFWKNKTSQSLFGSLDFWYNITITSIYFLYKDICKEVFILIVNYSFSCSWNSEKKGRISHLLSERILLLLGVKIFEKISSINFCEKEWIKDKLSENKCLLSDDRLVALHITEASHKKTYEIWLVNDILFAMLTPGEGQSHFDNLILELKNAIQNN
jgi:hypothetical protein